MNLCFLVLWVVVSLTSADDIVVQLSNRTLTERIPPDFISFSIEVSSARETFSFRGEPRPSWRNLMNELRTVGAHHSGPNFRIGGNSADTSAFVPSGDRLPAGVTYRVTDDDFAAYLAMMQQLNASLTLGLNFRNATSADLAVDHASAAFAYKDANGSLADWLQSVEVGNECDLFSTNGIRPSTYNYADYVEEFSKYSSEIQRGIGERRVQGATFCCLNSFYEHLPEYAKSFSASHTLHSVSFHAYALSHCDNKSNTIEQLLADSSVCSCACVFVIVRAV